MADAPESDDIAGVNSSAPSAGEDQYAEDDPIRQLQIELDDAIEARKRALADFKNYQRRALENEQRASALAASQVVRAIMPALDHFDLALNQNAEQMTVETLLQAVRIVRDEFAKALAAQGVERIDPQPGEAFDPNRHQAVKQEAQQGAKDNTIVATYQTGYAMGDLILRPATVVVAGE